MSLSLTTVKETTMVPAFGIERDTRAFGAFIAGCKATNNRVQ